jgi:hypothetical protein
MWKTSLSEFAATSPTPHEARRRLGLLGASTTACRSVGGVWYGKIFLYLVPSSAVQSVAAKIEEQRTPGAWARSGPISLHRKGLDDRLCSQLPDGSLSVLRQVL